MTIENATLPIPQADQLIDRITDIVVAYLGRAKLSIDESAALIGKVGLRL